MTFGTSAPVT